VVLAEDDTLGSGRLAEIFGASASHGGMPAPRTNEDLKRARKLARESSVCDIEKAFVLDALARNDWNITRAAEDTGMQRTNFQALIAKYNINLSQK